MVHEVDPSQVFTPQVYGYFKRRLWKEAAAYHRYLHASSMRRVRHHRRMYLHWRDRRLKPWAPPPGYTDY